MDADDEVNPYASPQVGTGVSTSARELAQRRLYWPTLGLMISASILLFPLAAFLILALLFAPFAMDVEITKSRLIELLVRTLVFSVILLAAWRMRQLRHLWFCRVMAIISCIPGEALFPSIAVPFGIWATVLLFSQNVAAEFDRVRR